MSSPNDNAPSTSAAVSSSEEAARSNETRAASRAPIDDDVTAIMSANDNERRSRQYELVDVDASIISVKDDSVIVSEFINDDDATKPPPKAVVAEEWIDAKNTLQSFDHAPGVRMMVAAPAAGIQPTLPDGQVITGKNTLQSFAVGQRAMPPPPMDPPDIFATEDNDDEAKRSLRSDPAPPIAATTTPPDTVVAVAVENAEVALDNFGNHDIVVAVPATPWHKNRSILGLLTIIVLLVAIVLGVTLGLLRNTTDASSSKDFPIATSLPTRAPIATSLPTRAPIAVDANITLRANVLMSYINNITLTNQIIMVNGTSPESQALAWLIHNDTTLVTSEVISQDDPIAGNEVGFRIRQQYPLLVMLFQQSDPLKWAMSNGWVADDSVCGWAGISCERRYVDYQIGENGFDIGGPQNAITKIYLTPSSTDAGTIPIEIGLLSTLEHFEIDNGLKATLPESIGRWTALTYFDVAGNALTGPLPDSIGRWTYLTQFDAAGNGLTGTLPDSIGQWTALTSFHAGINDLTGPLPASIGQWTALTYFNVYANALNGTLPDSIGNWTALTYFDVSYINGLTGTLPDSIGQWTALTYFNVYANAFTGTIAVSIGNWSLIEEAGFSGNQFVGTLPEAICKYIDPDLDFLRVDCAVNCTCCTVDCVSD